MKLVDQKIVRGWDDPRLFTLVALRRRGIPPGAILSFVNELGVSTARTNIQLARFENSVRKYLEQTVSRLMLILDPIPIIIDNLPDNYLLELDTPFSPKDPSVGSHLIPFTNRIYIDRSDFREVDSPEYFRLAPDKSIGLLKVPHPIKATSFTKDPATNLITEIHATYEIPPPGQTMKKPKTYIQWIAESPAHKSPIKAEIRYFNTLFKSDDPDTHPDGFMADLNPASEEIYPNAIIEIGLDEIRARAPWPAEAGERSASTSDTSVSASASTNTNTKVDGGGGTLEIGLETVRFQGLRVAYFAMDKDSREGKVVINRIVSLKEDGGKS